MAPRRGPALALGLGFALLPLIGLEVWLREEQAVVELLDDGRLYRSRPGRFGTTAEGLRPPALAPAPGARRVVVLGDSTTWGLGEAEAAWPAVLERRLGAGWRVYNLSTYGYDLDQLVALFEALGREIRPELVLYAAYTNDVYPTRMIRLGRYEGPVWLERSSGILPRPLWRGSATLRLAEGLLLAPSVREEPELDAFAAALRRLKAAVAQSGAALGLVGLVPHVLASADLAACDRAADRPGRCALELQLHAEELKLAAAAGLPALDTLPALRASGAAAFFGVAGDWIHADEAGHALIAGAVEAWLRADEGPLGASAAPGPLDQPPRR